MVLTFKIHVSLHWSDYEENILLLCGFEGEIQFVFTIILLIASLVSHLFITYQDNHCNHLCTHDSCVGLPRLCSWSNTPRWAKIWSHMVSFGNLVLTILANFCYQSTDYISPQHCFVFDDLLKWFTTHPIIYCLMVNVINFFTLKAILTSLIAKFIFDELLFIIKILWMTLCVPECHAHYIEFQECCHLAKIFWISSGLIQLLIIHQTNLVQQ